MTLTGLKDTAPPSFGAGREIEPPPLPPSGLPIVNYHSISRGDLDEPPLLAPEEAAHLVGEGGEEELLYATLARVEMLLREQTIHPNVLIAPTDKWTARFQYLVAAEALRRGHEAITPNGVVKFSIRDRVAWGRAFLRAKAENWWRRHRFPQLPTELEVTNNTELRLALFSDWATGLYGAPRIKQAIEADTQLFDYIIHLGDVYYMGEEPEVQQYLINGWPMVEGAVNRALNGNHEMYSGGNGYFNVALPWLDQPSSAFAIQNDRWLIVGLDSAYDDFDLGQGQEAWLAKLVTEAGERRVILLTHHQPFSNTSSEQGPLLQAKLARLLDAKRIFAWYWGHEHICAIYDQHPLWGVHGRCIGNGGFPELRPWYRDLAAEKVTNGVSFYPIKGAGANPACRGLDGPNKYVPGAETQYTAHGYVTLEISNSYLTETYRDADGNPLETLVLT